MGKFLGFLDMKSIGRHAEKLLPKALKSALPAGLDSIVDMFLKDGDKETAEKIKARFETDEAKLEYEKLALKKLENDQDFKLEAKRIELEEKEAELKDMQSARDFAKDDNLNGHSLSKVVRPAILITLTGAFLILIFAMFFVQVYAMFNDFPQAKELNSLFEMLLGFIRSPLNLVFMFYFSARTIDKISHKYFGNEDKEKEDQ